MGRKRHSSRTGGGATNALGFVLWPFQGQIRWSLYFRRCARDPPLCAGTPSGYERAPWPWRTPSNSATNPLSTNASSFVLLLYGSAPETMPREKFHMPLCRALLALLVCTSPGLGAELRLLSGKTISGDLIKIDA